MEYRRVNERLGIVTILILALSVMSCSNDESSDMKLSATLRTDNDSVYYRIDQYAGGFTFGDIAPYDTINNEVESDLTLLTTTDSVTFSQDTMPRYVKIVRGDSSVIITVTYFNQRRADIRKLALLREYDSFGSEANQADRPEFTYAPMEDENLRELRNIYSLDKVAGNENEITRILNVLRWANRIVPHDGSIDPADPRPRNAINIIATSKKEQKGVNCRMMATILNEAYLSLGFKARHVTCLPFDKEDNDCHVINMVYSDSLDKWLYVDPTFAGYFMDSDSNLLSIEEVRVALIAGDSLLLPDDLNWNGEQKNKMAYKNYMTKNLFRFACPIRSEYGYESNPDEVTIVYLNPAGYEDSLIGSADTSLSNGIRFITRYLSDARAFWAVP